MNALCLSGSIPELMQSCNLCLTNNKQYIYTDISGLQVFSFRLFKIQKNDNETAFQISSRCQLIFVNLCNSVFMMSLLNHSYCTTNHHSLVMVVDSDGGQRLINGCSLSGSSDSGCQGCLVCHSSCKSPIGL